MKIKDLIKLLKTYPDEMRIVRNGYEGGFDFISSVEKHTIVLDYLKNSNYQGDHELASEVDKRTEKTIQAIPNENHAESKANFIKRVERNSSLKREDVLIIS